MNVSRYRHSYTALGLCVLSALGVPWAGADEPPLLDTISREFSVNVGDPNAPNPVTDAISREFSVNVGDPNAAIPVRDAISREFSVNVGDPNAPIRVSDVISREFSVNVGDPSAPIPVREAISREFSVNVGDPASYVPVTDAVSREFSVYVPVPDLTITSLTAPSSVGVGESLSIEWDLANIGHKAATGPWQDCLYLSSDNTLGNDTQLDCYSHSEALEPGNTSTVTLNVMTPAVTPGTYWLIAQADQAYAISEVDEQNNTRVFGPIKVLPTLIPTEEASSNIIPAFGGDGLALELYLGIGGGGAPRPADLANRIPDGAFLAPYLDFPNPGSTVQISSNFTQFFANTIVPPDAVRDLQPQRFTLRSSTLLKVTAAEDRDPATPEIDLEIGVGSDDGYYLEVGNRFQGQAGDRGFSYSWHALRFESEGLYPLDLLFAANNSGFSGLELAWRTRSGESKIPQDALYRAAPGCDTLVEFDDFDPGTVLENQLSGQGLIFEALSGQPQVTDVRPGDFVPVSGTRVLADPRENPSEEVVLELRFVDPATGSNAVTNYFSCYVIDAEEIGATATVYNSLGEVLESRSFNLGGASQEFAAFSHPGMNRIVFNLGQGADTAALDNLCFTTPMPYNPADLQLQEIAIPAEVAPGEAVELSWTVANIGKGIARASWTDRVYLSPDSRAGDDIFLGETIRAADLAADESYVQSATLAIPDVADGNYFIVVVADAEGAVPDLNRGNNSSVVGTLSVSRPDLSTTLSTIPTYAAPESHIIVEWQVENHGDIRSRHAWSDCVYLSTDNTPGNDTLVACLPRPNDLAIGESYANSQSIQLPVVSEGHYWLYVVADGEDVVPEHNNEDNRSALLPIAIARTNLTPASINSQSVTSPSQVIGVEWFVENASIVEASASWRDGIYLSADDVAGNDTFLANFERPAPSDAGATYYQTQNVTLPDVPEGQYWLVLVTDDANVIAESDESDNVELFGPILITRVDLKSTIQGIDPQSPKSEGPVTISWNVENLSEALALYDWQDCVYLSSDAAIGDDTLLACIDNGDLLGGGASYESQLEVTLPALEAGNYWFVVKADGNDFVPESDEVNNSSIVGPFEIRVVLPPLIEPIDDQTAAQGQPFTGPAPVLTQGTAPVTWSLLQGPAGMTIEEETGVVSWEAPTEDFVPYTVVIRAANEAGSADAHWSVNVPLSYTATVMTDVSIVPAGTPIPLVGDATMVATGEPAPNKPVTVRVLVQDTRRVINVTTDENGAFETVFTPIPREGGFYAIGADHPLVPTDKSDDIFSIASMHLSPETLAVQLAPGTPVDEAVTLHNNGDEPLSGLAYELADAPQGVIVTLDAMPATLPAKAALPLTVHLLGLAPTSQPVEATLRIHSAEGTVATARLTMDVRPNTPQLVASPVSLDAGMVVGEQTLVETLLTNTGGAETGALEVVLPQSTWLSLSTPTLITSIEPGETRGVTISLTPPLDHVLGPYKGYYRVAGAQSNLTVPFTFTAVSEGKGDLEFTVVDEFTYFAEDKPPVAGAEIRLSNPYTGEPVEYVDPETGEPGTAVTGPDGTFTFHQLPEGYYEAAVSAPGHAFHRGAYRVPAHGTQEVQVFLSRQLVSYTWNVTPTEIEDRYDIDVDVTFETHVPAPVVTVDPPYIDITDMIEPVKQFDLTFANHGLIAAEDLTLEFTSTDQYTIVPLVENLGALPPLTSIVVPVIVYDNTKLGSAKSTLEKSSSGEPRGEATWRYFCFTEQNRGETIPVIRRKRGGGGSGGGGYEWGGGGGGSGRGNTPHIGSNNLPCECEADIKLNTIRFTDTAEIVEWGTDKILNAGIHYDGSPVAPVRYGFDSKPEMSLGISLRALNCDSIVIRARVGSNTLGTALVTRTSDVTNIELGGESVIPGHDKIGAFETDIDFEYATSGDSNWRKFGEGGPSKWYTMPGIQIDGGRAYDFTLDKIVEYATGFSDPRDIAEELTSGIANTVHYSPSEGDPPDPLMILIKKRAQCSGNAKLLTEMCRVAGIPANTLYLWAGSTPDRMDLYRKYVSGNGYHKASFRTPADRNGEAEENPHFTFHALTVAANYFFDPSYGTMSTKPTIFDEMAPPYSTDIDGEVSVPPLPNETLHVPKQQGGPTLPFVRNIPWACEHSVSKSNTWAEHLEQHFSHTVEGQNNVFDSEETLGTTAELYVALKHHELFNQIGFHHDRREIDERGVAYFSSSQENEVDNLILAVHNSISEAASSFRKMVYSISVPPEILVAGIGEEYAIASSTQLNGMIFVRSKNLTMCFDWNGDAENAKSTAQEIVRILQLDRSVTVLGHFNTEIGLESQVLKAVKDGELDGYYKLSPVVVGLDPLSPIQVGASSSEEWRVPVKNATGDPGEVSVYLGREPGVSELKMYIANEDNVWITVDVTLQY